ncbi:SPOR domain-containing protein [Flavihumibacter sp. R14]|nr:SPOR domain-containing protein [Flavihumibacter soli]
MKNVCLLIGSLILFLFSGGAFAQQRGKVEVIKDPQIDSLIARRAALSKSSKKSVAYGFRVQVFSSTDRKRAYAEQTKFKTSYPTIRSYISYAEPYYKLRVGDFRTRLEAEKLISKLKSSYEGLFIFAEPINPR